MLSLNFIREPPDLVKDGARKKGEHAPVDEILRLDAERREIVTKLEQLHAEQNRRSAAMAKGRDEAAVRGVRPVRPDAEPVDAPRGPLVSLAEPTLVRRPPPPGVAAR